METVILLLRCALRDSCEFMLTCVPGSVNESARRLAIMRAVS
jgi:hypothetical protein